MRPVDVHPGPVSAFQAWIRFVRNVLPAGLCNPRNDTAPPWTLAMRRGAMTAADDENLMRFYASIHQFLPE
jgi:hypothetical protein